MAGGVEYQVTKVDPTNPETKGMVYQVHKVTEEVAATLGGKVYRARIIKDPTEPTVAGKVYQIVLIDDPDDPAVKGKVYNAILTGDSEVVVVGPAISPLLLPDAIADSLTYVKAYGGTEQRDIPDNYLQRQFIYMMDGSYIKVEDLLISADYRIEFDFQTTTIASPLRNYIGGRANGVSAGGGFRLSKLASSNNNRVVLYGFESGTEYYDPTTQFQSNTRYKYTYDDGVCTLESGGSVVSTRTFTVTDTTSTKWGINCYVSGNDYWQTDSEGVYVYSLKVWNGQGELVMDLVPAVQKGQTMVVGFYDRATGGFRTPTAGTFAAGGEAIPTPDYPMDIVSNNGVIKARHQSGLPLGYTLLDYAVFDGTQVVDTEIQISTNDEIKSKLYATATGFAYGADTSNPRVTLYMSPGGNQRWGTGLSNNQGVPSLNTELTVIQNKTSISYNGTFYSMSTTSDFTTINTLTIGNCNGNTTTAKFSGNFYYMEIYQGGSLVAKMVPVKASNNTVGFYDLIRNKFLQPNNALVAGTAVSDPVEIYTDGTVETIEDTIGNTATAETLLKVGDYQDIQSIIDGAVTRNVGVKVLDGTEDGWTKTNNSFSNNTFFADKKTEKSTLFCSHFQYNDGSTSNIPDGCIGAASTTKNVYFRYDALSTVEDWTQYLADQYNAGTPVIVIYPLATPTTESVAGQTLQVTDGDNVLEITQASLNGLELEAEYEKEGA